MVANTPNNRTTGQGLVLVLGPGTPNLSTMEPAGGGGDGAKGSTLSRGISGAGGLELRMRSACCDTHCPVSVPADILSAYYT